MIVRAVPVGVALVAVVALVALAGCFQPPAVHVAQGPCTALAQCLFQSTEPFEIDIRSSAGATLQPGTLDALAAQIERFSGRSVVVERSTLGRVQDQVDDEQLRYLLPDGGPARLQLYVLNTSLVEDHQAVPGRAYPGVGAIYLFPAAMDGLVRRANLGDQAEISRAVLDHVVAVHMLGHALGLVGCGIPMVVPHSDQAVTCHSSNLTSIMQPRATEISEWPPYPPAASLGPFDFDAVDLIDVLHYGNLIRHPVRD